MTWAATEAATEAAREAGSDTVNPHVELAALCAAKIALRQLGFAAVYGPRSLGDPPVVRCRLSGAAGAAVDGLWPDVPRDREWHRKEWAVVSDVYDPDPVGLYSRHDLCALGEHHGCDFRLVDDQWLDPDGAVVAVRAEV